MQNTLETLEQVAESDRSGSTWRMMASHRITNINSRNRRTIQEQNLNHLTNSLHGVESLRSLGLVCRVALQFSVM
jgi:hypothetical protein